MRDSHNRISVVNALSAVTIATNTTTAGVTVDVQGFASLELVVRTGAWTDGAFAVSLTESDVSSSGFAAVAAGQVLGAGQSIGAANTLVKIGYLGSKRYVRVSIVSTATTSGASLSAIAVLERQRHTGGKAV